MLLNSERPDIIPIPASVTVPAGETELTFTSATEPVLDTIHVRVSAAYGGVTKGREVLILSPRLRALYLQDVIRGGGQGKLTVCLTGAAPTEGITVAATTSRPELAVPPTITIPEGKACLSIAVAAAIVALDESVTVTGTYGPRLRSDTAVIRNFPGPTPTATETATATATAIPAPVFSFTVVSGVPVASGGTVVFDVCLVSGSEIPYAISFDSSASDKAEAGADPATFETVGECEEGTLTDLPGAGSGMVKLQAKLGATVVGESDEISFPADPPTATATATETATNTPEPTATNTEVPTATATTAPAGPLTLIKNEVSGGTNYFDVAGSGFLPNSTVTLSGVTSSGYTWSIPQTTDGSGNFATSGYQWPCGGAYGANNAMTATDGVTTHTLDQPILC